MLTNLLNTFCLEFCKTMFKCNFLFIFKDRRKIRTLKNMFKFESLHKFQVFFFNIELEKYKKIYVISTESIYLNNFVVFEANFECSKISKFFRTLRNI